MKTTNEIRKSKAEGKMTMVSGTNNIIFDNGVVFSCDSSKEQNKLWNKLKTMGFEQHYNFSSDQFDGIIEASKIGENPFSFSIIEA